MKNKQRRMGITLMLHQSVEVLYIGLFSTCVIFALLLLQTVSFRVDLIHTKVDMTTLTDI